MVSKSTKEQPSLRTAREKSCTLSSCRSTTTSKRATTTTATTSTALLQHGSHTQPTTCCTIGCPTKANWLARLLLHWRGYNKKTEHHHNHTTEPNFAAPRTTSTDSSRSSRNHGTA